MFTNHRQIFAFVGILKPFDPMPQKGPFYSRLWNAISTLEYEHDACDNFAVCDCQTHSGGLIPVNC